MKMTFFLPLTLRAIQISISSLAWACSLALAILSLIASPAHAQSSANSISFQGALTGANGQPLPAANYNLTFKFYDVATNGVALATSNVPNVPVTGGVASTPIPVDSAWFNGQTRYFGITISGINGGQELAPRVLITAIPYAEYSVATRGLPVDQNGGVTINRADSDPLTSGAGNIWLTGGTNRSALLLGVNDDYAFVQSHGGRPLILNPIGNSVGIGGSRCVIGTSNGDSDRMPMDVDEVLVVGTAVNRGVGTKAGLFFDTNNRNGGGIIVEKIGDGGIENHRMHFYVTQEGEPLSRKVMTLTETGWVGIGKDIPQSTLDVNGITRTKVLQITGGADLAEHFTVTAANPSKEFNVEPGMVISIDPSGNRKFKLSDEPYDRKRVGIISGGNGIKPGLLLGDEGNPAVAGDQPIALTGQVWCQADASPGAITPGDLLTTSSTPGHAMKVTDDAKARFAVLGQALTDLKKGRGWVQVLVGKQYRAKPRIIIMKYPNRLLTLAILILRLAANTSFAQDTDHDGISDQLEQRILETYRPWLYYDHDETVWPCSATWFVQHSRLIGNPSGDVDQSVLQSDPRIVLKTTFGPWTKGSRHSPLKLDLNDDSRTGQFANDPALSINVPIYGHVVQLSDSPDESSLAYPGFQNRFGADYIAMQYWMLFPYNDTHAFDAAENVITGLDDIGDHEGDWAWIDILLNRSNGLPEYVVYHHHGDGNIPPSVVEWNEVEKRNGAPIVYLEKGTHELWPHAGDGHGITGAILSILTGLGSLLDWVAQNPSIAIEPHQGNGQQYRPTTVINLGEAGNPITQDSPSIQLDADLALLFSGEWGDFTGLGQTNPDAPVNQKFPITNRSDDWPINIYVDFGYAGVEIGTQDQPFSHLGDAVQNVAANGTIVVRTGNSGEHLTINRPCTIRASGGMVTVGQ